MRLASPGRAWCAKFYFHHRVIQHIASPHILRDPLQGSHPWRWEGSDSRWFTVWKYVVFCYSVSFHHSNTSRLWFVTHYRMQMEFLPPYSPFLNQLKTSAQHADGRSMITSYIFRWPCENVTADTCRGWIRHSKSFSPWCIAREDIHCDVDESLWPNRQECQEV